MQALSTSPCGDYVCIYVRDVPANVYRSNFDELEVVLAPTQPKTERGRDWAIGVLRERLTLRDRGKHIQEGQPGRGPARGDHATDACWVRLADVAHRLDSAIPVYGESSCGRFVAVQVSRVPEGVVRSAFGKECLEHPDARIYQLVHRLRLSKGGCTEDAGLPIHGPSPESDDVLAWVQRSDISSVTVTSYGNTVTVTREELMRERLTIGESKLVAELEERMRQVDDTARGPTLRKLTASITRETHERLLRGDTAICELDLHKVSVDPSYTPPARSWRFTKAQSDAWTKAVRLKVEESDRLRRASEPSVRYCEED